MSENLEDINNPKSRYEFKILETCGNCNTPLHNIELEKVYCPVMKRKVSIYGNCKKHSKEVISEDV